MMSKYVIGVDYGTDSVRAMIVDAINGNEITSAESKFVRWSQGLYCDPLKNKYRQHPADYIEGLETVITKCLGIAGPDVQRNIYGISIAATGSTPVATDEHGTPLSLLEEFKDDPDAMFILWKDHTAVREAEGINSAAKNYPINYLQFVGGAYSSEWYWAKLLHTLRRNRHVREKCVAWIEHSDWIPFLLTGGNDAGSLKRNVCAAGHKALWSEKFEGLPPIDFFGEVDPVLVPFAERFGREVFAADQPAGHLSEEWAKRFGLDMSVIVGIGAIDAHVGAVGGGIKPYQMCKVIGTSTCDMIVVAGGDMHDRLIDGICGQVTGSIVPGLIGLEAGQSAFGDIYSWFRDLLLWPLKINLNRAAGDLYEVLEDGILQQLDKGAAELDLDENLEFAIDWFNGRRTPHANPALKGLIGGLTLGSDPVRIYRALVEATCFGSKAILESVEQQGIRIDTINAIGGIPSKSKFVIQMLANVLNRPVEVSSVNQTVALGAAMLASVASGIHPTIEAAGEVLGKKAEVILFPDEAAIEFYNKRYGIYKRYGALQEKSLEYLC